MLDDKEVAVEDFGIRIAELEIESTYGDTVSVEAKKKTLLKFGRNESVDTSTSTVWLMGGNETYVTTNAIDTVSSSNSGDTQSIRIEGHTVTGTGTTAEFTFLTQLATLNGQNKVTLTTPLARCSRAYITTNSTFAGNVHIYENSNITLGVPDDLTKAHLKMMATESQSFKCATTFSNTDYFICTGGFASVDKQTSARVDFEMQVRLVGSVFRPVARFTLDSGSQNTVHIPFYPYTIVPKNSDIRVVATGSTTSVEVSAAFQGFIAAVI